MTGEIFSYLSVIGFDGKDKNHQAKWKCTCKCGNIVTVVGRDLRSGHTKSCGCYHIEKITKHGLRGTKLRGVHKSMIQRCYNENNKSYCNYGGRNIRVCEEWQGSNGLESFYKWALSNGYREGLTLDRIDVNGNYEPENCRWTTMKHQQRNKRTSRLVTINGVEKHIGEWEEETGVNRETIWRRFKSGLKDNELLKSQAKYLNK